jgi:hypothetical protein
MARERPKLSDVNRLLVFARWPQTPAPSAEDERRLIHCTYCHKSHAVRASETPCAPGAWIEIDSPAPSAPSAAVEVDYEGAWDSFLDLYLDKPMRVWSRLEEDDRQASRAWLKEWGKR